MSARKLAIFDFDGTLADFKQVGEAVLSAFSASIGKPHDAEKLYVGYFEPLVCDLGWGVALDEQPDILRQFDAFSAEQMGVHHRFLAPLFGGIAEMVEQLAQTYDLAIITARQKASFLAVLQYNDLSKHFPHYRTKCCMTNRGMRTKPAPDAIYSLLAETGHRIEETVMIGDTATDIAMAKNAGAKSIAVSWGMHDAAKLAAAGPDLLIAKVRELPVAIAKVFGG